jgi:hypothetical protein
MKNNETPDSWDEKREHELDLEWESRQDFERDADADALEEMETWEQPCDQ